MNVPSGRTATEHAKALGGRVWYDYKNLREKYKRDGLTPREACKRAYIELHIGEQYRDFRQRTTMTKVLDKQVPLTPKEMKEAIPSYTPPGLSHAEEVGHQDMTLSEQINWAMKWAARVQNGEDSPTKFPCDGALFWFQSALANRSDFEKVLVRVQGPSEGDNPYLQDGQHQMKEIERQIGEAVRECGERLVEMEAEFGELLKETAV